jgi:hypothetical protein
MKFAVPLALLFGLSATSAFAETWSGMLVNAKCYAAEQRNVNPLDTETAVDTDKGAEIRYCAPKLKTKFFAVVERDGGALRFDPAGDAKAAAFVQSAGKQRMYAVAVTGQLSGKRIQVESISPASLR